MYKKEVGRRENMTYIEEARLLYLCQRQYTLECRKKETDQRDRLHCSSGKYIVVKTAAAVLTSVENVPVPKSINSSMYQKYLWRKGEVMLEYK